LQGDDVRGTSCTVRLNIEKAMEIRRLSRLKSFVGDGYDFIFDTLLNFEPMKRLEKRSDVAEFWRFRNCTSGRVKNVLETIKLRLGKVEKK
jgi:hypothetical protein